MNVEIKNCPAEIANDIWNAAIEAAAKCVDQAKLADPYYTAPQYKNDPSYWWGKNNLK